MKCHFHVDCDLCVQNAECDWIAAARRSCARHVSEERRVASTKSRVVPLRVTVHEDLDCPTKKSKGVLLFTSIAYAHTSMKWHDPTINSKARLTQVVGGAAARFSQHPPTSFSRSHHQHLHHHHLPPTHPSPSPPPPRPCPAPKTSSPPTCTTPPAKPVNTPRPAACATSKPL